MKHPAHTLMTSSFVLIVSLWLYPVGYASADWRDWWRTPEQQAKEAFDNDDIEALDRLAPDQAWKGVAEHKSADYEAAANTFNEVVTQQDLAGNIQGATQALYNRGVSEVRSGQYEKAVETFENVLERNPQFVDAEHNRDIASQLLQQQQQQSQPQDSDESNDGESQDQTDQQTPANDEQQSQSGEEEQSGSEQDGNPEQAESGEQQDEGNDESGVESEEQNLQDQQAARDALQAEASAGDDDNDPLDSDEQVNNVQREEPLSEIEQATEQWLRRIPDDPEGLLRRKLEQSHRSEYPEVRDAQEPW